jgi:hypothetical protein
MVGRGPRPALLSPVALLALAAAWLCAPAAVRATCGDYVTLDPRPPAAAHQPHDPTLPPMPPVPAPAPCHGPRCSGGSLPPLLPVTVAPEVPEQWGDIPQPPSAGDSRRFAGWWEQTLRGLAGNPSSVYHPPRLGPISSSLS